MMADPTWGHPTDVPRLELDQSENPWRTEITDVSFKVDKDGHVAVPTKPGLGITVDEKPCAGSWSSKSYFPLGDSLPVPQPVIIRIQQPLTI